MQKRTGLVLALVLALATASVVSGKAHAQYSTGVLCDTDGPVPLNTVIECTAYSNNPKVNDLHITIIDPEGNVINQIDIDPWDRSAYNFQFTGDKAGEWTVITNFTHDGTRVFKVIISWLVLPESPIGAVAILGSTLGALGAFMGLRQRKAHL